jgi:predicted tellurium resistance membrane protein TerC
MLHSLTPLLPPAAQAQAQLAAVPAAGGAGLLGTGNLIALLTLTALEIVLGIDNVIFVAILAAKLPPNQQARARQLGISAAVITRILLLLSITQVMRLTEPLFTVMGKEISGRDLILLAGGAFLVAKATYEIHDKLETAERPRTVRPVSSVAGVIVQIMLIDVVFSLDSVITAVGLSGEIVIMVAAIVIAAAVMLFAAGAISSFVERHPTMKILALAFLILIGVMLLIEGWNPELAHELHIKNYAYVAMAFAFIVELINMRLRPPLEPLQLRRSHLPEGPEHEAEDPSGRSGAS